MAMSQSVGGVGFYPRDKFVHLDTGKVRHWWPGRLKKGESRPIWPPI